MTSFFPLSAQAADCGRASYYGVGDGFHGLTTANGEKFDTYTLTAAHRTLPFGTRLRVTYDDRSVIVRINDRGPYIQGRELDLSYAAFKALASPNKGLIDVCYSHV